MKAKRKMTQQISVFFMVLVFMLTSVRVLAAGTTMDAATDCTLGTRVDGSVSEAQKSQFYKVTLQESGVLKLNMSTQVAKIDIEFYNASREKMWDKCISWDSTSGMGNYSLEKNLLAGSYYFVVKLYDYWGDVYPGNYNFTFSYTSAGETFPESQAKTNNEMSMANAVAVNGTKYIGQLAEEDEVDYYKFDLPTSGKLTINHLIYTDKNEVYIYDVDGKSIWDNYIKWDSTSKMGKLTTDVELTSGSYYYVVKRDSWYDCKGKYEFDMTFTSALETFPEGKGGINNSLAQASDIQFDQVVNGHLAINDDKDYYKLAVPSPRNLNLQLKSTMKGVKITVFDASGSDIYSKDVSADGTTGQIVFNDNKAAVNAGIYYIYIGPSSWYTSKGTYSLTVGTYVPATSVKMSKSKLTLTAGQKATLKASAVPADATNPGIIWSSTNSNIVKVSSTGKITAVAAGSATIYATSADDDSIKGSCVVTVKPKQVNLKSVKNYKYKYSKTKAFKATWSSVKGASGYQVVYAKDSKFKKSVKKYFTYGTPSYRSGIKKGTYYVKVRAYVNVNGKKVYGAYSKAKKVYVK